MTSRPLDHTLRAVTGYTDRLSYRPGEAVSVHASSVHADGTVRLVRLGHDGTAFTTEGVTPPARTSFAHRDTRLGSYGLLDAITLPAAPVTVSLWVWLDLLPGDGSAEAVLFSSADLTLVADATGHVACRAGDGTIATTMSLRRRTWYAVEGGLDSERRPFVAIQPGPRAPVTHQSERIAAQAAVEWKPRASTVIIGQGLDGKIEEVSIRDSARRVLRLDFSKGISTWDILDDRGRAAGHFAGLPKRAAPGRLWDGSQYDWRHAAHHYAAVQFHTDDQCDQRWPVTTTVALPDDLPGGMYAVELRTEGGVDYLPVAVRRGETEAAPLLVVLPTLTYLAYALEHVPDEDIKAQGWPLQPELAAEFARLNGYHSLYDVHADGSPVVLASLHRPLLGMRPDHILRYAGCEHCLSADLHLLGWLRRQGIAFDLATDHDLDAEGTGLLAPYRAVVTGAHPEYWTARMLDALRAYLDDGGRAAYLGGNGFCWTTAVDPGDPAVVEIRRGVEAGQEHLQLTGQRGGPWNKCGRPSSALVGATWGVTGMAPGAAFQRTADSFDPRVSHLFEGIGHSEPIGESGAFWNAAASFEVDFANPLLGTPSNALVVATAAMPEQYRGEGAAFFGLRVDAGGETDASLRRADMTFFETQSGGAVFSASSIGWIGALSHNNDDNAASRLTANLLHSFSKPREDR